MANELCRHSKRLFIGLYYTRYLTFFSIFGDILKIVDFYLLKLEESINPLSIMIQI
jgi:hypothetical protein